MKRRFLVSLALLAAFGLASAIRERHSPPPPVPVAGFLQTEDPELKLIEHARTPSEKIVNGAKMEAIRVVTHDGAYYRISYPGGDIPANRGACTDVVIRAMRNAGYDLQKLMHEDMAKNFGAYPHYGLNHPDPNIDHRRVPNQMVFFRRHSRTLPLETTGGALKAWQPGDIIYWKLWDRLDHCGVISNDRNADGVPLVIHNIGESKQADCLTRWRIIGHFRYPPRQ